MADSKTKLQLETADLTTAGSYLCRISEDFDDANDRCKGVVELFGGTTKSSDRRALSSEIKALRRAILDFDEKWNDRRRKLKEGIDALATSLTEIAKAFNDTDEVLAVGLEASEQPSGVM